MHNQDFQKVGFRVSTIVVLEVVADGGAITSGVFSAMNDDSVNLHCETKALHSVG